jgi:DNA (cytosine-5)-methyltransferase 1
MVKYSEIKELLKINTDKNVITENAYITHYLQNFEINTDKPYKKQALYYLSKRIELKKLSKLHRNKIVWDVAFPPPKNPSFKFIDLFAGIGGFRIVLQELGGKCVFSSEIDNAVKQTYAANFGEFPFGDIRDFTDIKISDKQLNKLIPDHNILAAGFPCQPFSLAGVSARTSLGQEHGFLDEVKGTLFFDIARIIKVKQPDIVFLENVKNFQGHNDGKTYKIVQNTMKDFGYKLFSTTINAEKLVPQIRQRFYMICFREDILDFKFPEFEGEAKKLKDYLEENVSEYFTISDKLWIGHQNRTKRNLERGTGFTAHLADLNKPSKTLVARYGKDGKECLIPQEGKNPRKLTPRECARLQGFPENFILPVSNAAAYYQFGNSVSVPVVKAIAEEFIKYLD